MLSDREAVKQLQTLRFSHNFGYTYIVADSFQMSGQMSGTHFVRISGADLARNSLLW